jgi:hypothetical protein
MNLTQENNEMKFPTVKKIIQEIKLKAVSHKMELNEGFTSRRMLTRNFSASRNSTNPICI